MENNHNNNQSNNSKISNADDVTSGMDEDSVTNTTNHDKTADDLHTNKRIRKDTAQNHGQPIMYQATLIDQVKLVGRKYFSKKLNELKAFIKEKEANSFAINNLKLHSTSRSFLKNNKPNLAFTANIPKALAAAAIEIQTSINDAHLKAQAIMLKHRIARDLELATLINNDDKYIESIKNETKAFFVKAQEILQPITGRACLLSSSSSSSSTVSTDVMTAISVIDDFLDDLNISLDLMELDFRKELKEYKLGLISALYNKSMEKNKKQVEFEAKKDQMIIDPVQSIDALVDKAVNKKLKAQLSIKDKKAKPKPQPKAKNDGKKAKNQQGPPNKRPRKLGKLKKKISLKNLQMERQIEGKKSKKKKKSMKRL